MRLASDGGPDALPTVVSTADHPYLSPPPRLIDTHARLAALAAQGERVAICVWDAMDVPDNGLYATAAGVDTGLIASREDDLFTFERSVFYPWALVRPIDLGKLRRYLAAALDAMTDLPTWRREKNAALCLERFDRLAGIYNEVTKTTKDAFTLYSQILPALYRLFGLGELADFVSQRFFSGYRSAWLRRHLVTCLQETVGQPTGLGAVATTATFQKRLFRRLDGSDLDFISMPLEDLTAGITDGSILPSSEVIFWSFALGGIKHFGNDYGFFARLADVPGFEHAAALQLTAHNDDGRSPFRFAASRAFSVSEADGQAIVTRVAGRKDSRTDSLPAFFLHLGPQPDAAALTANDSPRLVEAGLMQNP